MRSSGRWWGGLVVVSFVVIAVGRGSGFRTLRGGGSDTSTVARGSGSGGWNVGWLVWDILDVVWWVIGRSTHDLSAFRFDGSCGTGLVRVIVVFTSRVILDFNGLDNHVEWSLAVISWSLGPFNDTGFVL